MKRLMEKTVFWGLVTAWRLATVPTRRSPDCANATTDGVVRPPSAFSMTVGSPPSRTAMHEFVVPRSIPMVLPIVVVLPLAVAAKNLSRSIGDLAPRTRRGLSGPRARPRPGRSRAVPVDEERAAGGARQRARARMPGGEGLA